jgi:hypothetical protein
VAENNEEMRARARGVILQEPRASFSDKVQYQKLLQEYVFVFSWLNLVFMLPAFCSMFWNSTRIIFLDCQSNSTGVPKHARVTCDISNLEILAKFS